MAADSTDDPSGGDAPQDAPAASDNAVSEASDSGGAASGDSSSGDGGGDGTSPPASGGPAGQAAGGELHDTTSGGVAGSHPPAQTGPSAVAPSTASEFNRIVKPLIPIACWRVEDHRFAFDSSFVTADIALEVPSLARVRRRHRIAATPGQDGAEADGFIYPRATIFGHADPVGDDDYNKTLSGRRALSIYALLTRDVSIWETLYSTRIKGTGDKWGAPTIQAMIAKLGSSSVSDFQQANGLSADGDAGPGTRKVLFQKYMDAVCGDLRLDKADDFLVGTDDKGKGDVQGCSEFNPLLIFSQQEIETFKDPNLKAERDLENAPNRRVLMLLFNPTDRADADKWPCPRATEGAEGCKPRFWSDGDTRRTATETRRIFGASETFACRFYERFARLSPCEGASRSLRIWLHDHLHQKMPVGTRYRLSISDDVRTGTLSTPGLLVEGNVVAWSSTATVEYGQIPAAAGYGKSAPELDRLKQYFTQGSPYYPFSFGATYDQGPDDVYRYWGEVILDIPRRAADDDSKDKRLANMGYPEDAQPVEDIAFQWFQNDYALDPQGDDATTRLSDYHRRGTEAPLGQPNDADANPGDIDEERFETLVDWDDAASEGGGDQNGSGSTASTGDQAASEDTGTQQDSGGDQDAGANQEVSDQAASSAGTSGDEGSSDSSSSDSGSSDSGSSDSGSGDQAGAETANSGDQT